MGTFPSVIEPEAFDLPESNILLIEPHGHFNSMKIVRLHERSSHACPEPGQESSHCEKEEPSSPSTCNGSTNASLQKSIVQQGK